MTARKGCPLCEGSGRFGTGQGYSRDCPCADAFTAGRRAGLGEAYTTWHEAQKLYPWAGDYETDARHTYPDRIEFWTKTILSSMEVKP